MKNPINDEDIALKAKHANHLISKLETHEERTRDRLDKSACVVDFDLQNVFALPKADVSNFFYKRKLNVYHLTGHCSITGQSYGALWPETLSGRSGNDIGSALVVILDRITQDNPGVKDIILWSDSCIPQNRNKVMTTAIKLFLDSHPSVQTITQKYCEPGHSEVQEIDNLHSQLEQVMAVNEVYSPIGLMRILCNSPRKKPIKIVQLRKTDMKDYHAVSNNFKFDVVPYSRVKALHYSRDALMSVNYRVKFDTENWNETNLQPIFRTRGQQDIGPAMKLTMPKNVTKLQNLTKEKVADICCMFAFMPEVDRDYMQSIIRNESTSEKVKVNRKKKTQIVDQQAPSTSAPSTSAEGISGASTAQHNIKRVTPKINKRSRKT